MMRLINKFINFFSIRPRKIQNFFVIFSAMIILLFATGSCGLFEKKLPPGGEFCNVLVKPPECLNVDFVNLEVKFSETEKYPLIMINRVQYSFLRSEEMIQLDLHSENRIQLSDGKFYLRRKIKK